LGYDICYSELWLSFPEFMMLGIWNWLFVLRHISVHTTRVRLWNTSRNSKEGKRSDRMSA